MGGLRRPFMDDLKGTGETQFQRRPKNDTFIPYRIRRMCAVRIWLARKLAYDLAPSYVRFFEFSLLGELSAIPSLSVGLLV